MTMTKKVFIVNTDTGKISKAVVLEETPSRWKVKCELMCNNTNKWVWNDGTDMVWRDRTNKLWVRAFDTFDKASAVARDIVNENIDRIAKEWEACKAIIDANIQLHDKLLSQNVEIKCDSCLDTGKVECEHCYGGNSTFEDDEATECDWCDGDGYTNAPCDHCEKGRQLEKAELSRNRL